MPTNLPNPSSSFDQYLNAMAGGNSSNLPEPKSPLDSRMKSIAENGGSGGGGGGGAFFVTMTLPTGGSSTVGDKTYKECFDAFVSGKTVLIHVLEGANECYVTIGFAYTHADTGGTVYYHLEAVNESITLTDDTGDTPIHYESM